MKKCWIRYFMSWVICFSLIFPYSFAFAADYAFVDYTRVYSSSEGKKYDVTMEFGPIVMTGKLSYTGQLTRDEINEEIAAVLKRLGKTPKEMQEAQDLVNQVKKDTEFSDEDAKHILDNISKILGVDSYYKVGEGIYDYVAGNAGGVESFFRFLSNASEVGEGILSDKIQEWAKQESIKEMLEHGSPLAYVVEGIMDEGLEIGSATLSRFAILQMIWNTINISHDEWKLDKERWARRAAAVEAMSLIETFYTVLNHNLAQRDAQSANWVIKVNGRRTRDFYFFGTEGNKQTMTAALVAVKDNSEYTTYGWRGARYNMPFGYYKGSAAVKLTHDLLPFDSAFWNLPICGFKEGWFNDIVFATSIYGEMKASLASYTFITRNLTADDFTFYIGGGWSQQYSSIIPATIGNRDVSTTIPIGTFEDEIKVNQQHTAALTWGAAIEDSGAAGGVAFSAHADMSSDTVMIYFDNLDFAVASVIGFYKDGSYQNVLAGTETDSNIWLLMDKGMKLTVHFR